jgi:hypothetical protein
MQAMRNRENILPLSLGGAMVIAIAGLFVGTHYQALLHPGVGKQAGTQAAVTNPNVLNIATVDEMCKAAGATAGNMASCREQESAAAEFVIAWMGFNGFIVNGGIDMDQIQLAATLGPEATSPLSDSDPLLDPSADPSLGQEPNIDPATGLPVDQSFETPAQIAMFCMSGPLDWLQLHDCISRYDPSTRFNGGL